MFIQITDDKLASSIAREMIRVAKTEGYIILVDWRYSNPRDKNYKALSIKRIDELFEVSSKTKIHGIHRGALIPPIGRFVSKRARAGYFLLTSFLPFFVGQIAVVLQKSHQSSFTQKSKR